MCCVQYTYDAIFLHMATLVGPLTHFTSSSLSISILHSFVLHIIMQQLSKLYNTAISSDVTITHHGYERDGSSVRGPIHMMDCRFSSADATYNI